ncbi:peptidyl-tRNA hydrolase [Decorospora gaudefroyi]|uniref:peptidyl-tRNA hydrolase n=1 Tax=Decorospora gaudefroyi TaxID=184978 RepID=A0A6A5KVK9_9PLEO|nr:peptidyl-tRNA hydrolase [Decorospora gaudefroyi]
MRDATTRAHVVSPTGTPLLLIPAADRNSEIPQTPTRDEDDDSSEPAIEVPVSVRKTHKHLQRHKRIQERRGQNDITAISLDGPKVEISQNQTQDDTEREPTLIAAPVLAQNRTKPQRKQNKHQHNSALLTPTPTPPTSATEQPPPALHSTLPMAKPATQTAYPLLICSIGNPGPAYSNTLHSAGHHLTASLSASKNYQPFTKGLSGLVSRPQNTHMQFGLLGYKRVASDKPDAADDWTFWQSPSLMNVSGSHVKRAYSEWLRSIRLAAGNAGFEGRLVVVHDELEAQLGKVSVRDGASSAKGHNGIKSCQQQLGRVRWWRVGVGIGRPDSRDPDVVSKYVLGKMTAFQRGALEKSAVPVYKALERIAAGSR